MHYYYDLLYFLLFTLAALGLPGTSGFVGEFLILMGVFKKSFLVAVIASLGVILGVAFSMYVENLRQFLSTVFNISLFPEEIYFLSTMPSEINPSSIFVISKNNSFI